ncbi:MAG: bifunctional [glutamate--ammonia ligase]-adenylyl-L-tyrosine phosphorylase/[glutamate--ammonia-ligase] adenylyltransferase, partial [Nitrospirota bacterium]
GNLKEAGYAVISMGKLGGEELNFSSDIDLIFAYDEEGDTEGILKYDEHTNRITNNLFFIKLGESIIHAISEITDEGYCYRIDMRLRPEGRVGALARSLNNTEIYYESWGETWERQALIKARFSAGNEDVGRRFIEMIRPFIYRKYMDYASITEIKHTKDRIDQVIGGRGERFHQVKLGYGGIREIEFIVQALQLLYGGRNPGIREINTLKALDKLSGYNYLKDKDIALLVEGYKFLRRVEHRLQMLYEFQTHTLPKEKKEILKLAKRLGYNEKTINRFEKDYKRYTENVRGIFENLFSKGNEKGVEIPPETGLILLPDIKISDIKPVLNKYGFSDIKKAYKNIMLLRGSEESPLTPRTKNLLANIMPAILSFSSRTPDPDSALNNLERFLSKANMKEGYFKIFSTHPYILELLINLFGSSQFLSNILIKSPELFDGLVATDILNVKKTKEQMIDEFEKTPLTLTLSREGRGEGEGAKGFFNRLRRYKNSELIRIGVRDILNLSDMETIFEELSDLADAVIQVLLEYFYSHPHPPSSPLTKGGERGVSPLRGDTGGSTMGIKFAIIGLGKFGGRELDYGSDLDIIFVYSMHPPLTPPPSSPHRWGRIKEGELLKGEGEGGGLQIVYKLCENIINASSEIMDEGILYRIDPRLRPLGKDGPLAMDLEAYKKYFKEWAQLWERQAYIKARHVAGDRELAGDFIRLAHDFVYFTPATETDAAEINRTRNRMIDELVAPQHRGMDIKLSAGGIVDIEFIVQILQLRYGHADKDVRNANTISALRSLKEKEYISEADYHALADAYYFLRGIEHGLRIVEDSVQNILPMDEAALIRLARRIGYEGRNKSGGRLFKDFKVKCKIVRGIYNKVFLSHLRIFP